MAFPAGGVNPTPCEGGGENPVESSLAREIGLLIAAVQTGLTVYCARCRQLATRGLSGCRVCDVPKFLPRA